MATTKQKKKARRPRKAARLPKAVEALLNYLGPPTIGAPTIQQTGQRFASMGGIAEPSKGFATQVAEAVVARQAAMKAARIATGAEPLKKSLVSTIIPPRQQQPTIILQQPAQAQAQAQAEAPPELMRKTLAKRAQAENYAKRLEAEVERLQKEQRSREGSTQLPPSQQEPTELSTEPIAASGVGEFLAGQYQQSLATAELPPAQKLRGRAPAAPKEPKEPKPRGRPKKAAAPPTPTFSQAVGGLAAVAQAQTPSSVSSVSSTSSSKSRAREIFETASRQGLSGGDLVYAMAQGGGAAAEPQQVGRSLSELTTRRTKRGMKVVGFSPAESSVEV